MTLGDVQRQTYQPAHWERGKGSQKDEKRRHKTRRMDAVIEGKIKKNE